MLTGEFAQRHRNGTFVLAILGDGDKTGFVNGVIGGARVENF
jgi:hypothetical protein